MELRDEIKKFIIKTLKLDLSIEKIGDETPLFGEAGLGLDSIDALELIIGLEKQFGVKVADDIDGEKVLSSVAAITEYIEKKKENQNR